MSILDLLSEISVAYVQTDISLIRSGGAYATYVKNDDYELKEVHIDSRLVSELERVSHESLNFVIAHELGHWAEGHLSLEKDKGLVGEMEADIHALVCYSVDVLLDVIEAVRNYYSNAMVHNVYKNHYRKLWLPNFYVDFQYNRMVSGILKKLSARYLLHCEIQGVTPDFTKLFMVEEYPI